MSHHLDTPLAAQNGQLYIDDLYVFDGNDGTVFVMDVNSSITGNDIKRGFHPNARYEFKVHFDDAEMETLTYRVAFGQPEGDGQQSLTLHAVTGADASHDEASGNLIVQGRSRTVASNNGTRIWAGRITDPFYIDLDQLATINTAFQNGSKVDRAAWRPENAKNSFAGKTVEAIVVEVSHQDPLLPAGADVRVWCATKLETDHGGWRQVNRAGHPMMWPIFRPKDTDFSSEADSRHPSQDLQAEGDIMASVIARVVAANDTSGDPDGYARLVTRQLLPDVLPYRIGSPASYGFAEMNGRTLSDNVPEVMFSMVLDTGTPSGLTAEVTAKARDTKFPYVMPA